MAVVGGIPYVEAGTQIGFGAGLDGAMLSGAQYVDKILRGAKAADLPIEQPTNYRLNVNLKTAKALGIAFPQSLLARADELIR